MKKYLGYAIVSFLMAGSTLYANEMQIEPSFEQPSEQAATYRKEVLSICEQFASILVEAGFQELAAQCDKASVSAQKGLDYIENIITAKESEKNKSKKALLNYIELKMSESVFKLIDRNLTSNSLLPEIKNEANFCSIIDEAQGKSKQDCYQQVMNETGEMTIPPRLPLQI